MSALPSDDDWVWVSRKDGAIGMYGWRPKTAGGKWLWRLNGRPFIPAWNDDLSQEIMLAFTDWAFVRASRAEAEALIAMARAGAA